MTLLPMMTAVFIAYLVIGLAMPVLPIHVHQRLGFSTFVVGRVAGTQFAATLISRIWAGQEADSRGARFVLVAGIVAAAASDLLYLASLAFVASPLASVTILLLGRALLGAAESFIVLGALSWGLTLAGPQNTGMVMAQIGTAMYLAYAAGAPAGSALYAIAGFAAIALATTVIPLIPLLLVAQLPAVPPRSRPRPAFASLLGAVWVPGLGLALSSVGAPPGALPRNVERLEGRYSATARCQRCGCDGDATALVICLIKDRDALLTFYDFPAEPPAERLCCSYGTVRLDRTSGTICARPMSSVRKFLPGRRCSLDAHYEFGTFQLPRLSPPRRLRCSRSE